MKRRIPSQAPHPRGVEHTAEWSRRGLLSGAVGMVGAVAPAHVPGSTPTPKAPSVLRLDKRRIDATLTGFVSDGRVAGASVLLWQGGREAHFAVAGHADREAGRRMSRDTLVQLHSMTKPVTGVALMRLWEDGRFRLDDPLGRHLPEFADMKVAEVDAGGATRLRPATRPILIRDLLRHTAGLSYGMGDGPADRAYRAADPLAPGNDLQEMGRRLGALPLLADPGEVYRYSAAVDVQALLIETLADEPFEDHVHRRVLEPLGMEDTGWRQPAERLGRLAAVYSPGSDGGLVRQDDVLTQARNFAPRRLISGGSGLASTIDDYMRFSRMLLNEGVFDGVRILRSSTVRLMRSDQLDPAITERDTLPDKGAYSFGLDLAVRTALPVSPDEAPGAVGEAGWDGWASTLFWIDPANDLACIFLVQLVPFDDSLHRDLRRAVHPGRVFST